MKQGTSDSISRLVYGIMDRPDFVLKVHSVMSQCNFIKN
jgi:hypothetical protein